MLSDSQPDDELSIFAGRTRLVSSEQSFASPVPAPRQPPSKPTHTSGQPGTYPHQGPLDHRLLPHEPLPSMHVVLPDSYLDNYHATFADLSGGWDGLFHEVPQPSYGYTTNPTPHAVRPSGEGAMLDDRWTSFMHNYNILTEPPQRQIPTC